MPPERLHPDPPLLHSLDLDAGGGHRLHVQVHGSASGIPALVLHGGPGSGCTPLLRRWFDPQRYRIICIDQRGAGASRPRGGTQRNTTADLLADLALLREALGIARWLVVGGSWGAALAIAHAADRPDAVAGLLLRSTFAAREQDIDWFFQGAAEVEPQAWERFAAVAPPAQRGALLAYLAGVFESSEPAPCRAAALAWREWEHALAALPATPPPPQGDALDALVARYRVQCHYLAHACWLTAPPLLERGARVPPVPTLFLHGDDDRVCRPEPARALHGAIAHSGWHWVHGSGHDAAHPAMIAATCDALDRYAATGQLGSA